MRCFQNPVIDLNCQFPLRNRINAIIQQIDCSAVDFDLIAYSHFVLKTSDNLTVYGLSSILFEFVKSTNGLVRYHERRKLTSFMTYYFAAKMEAC